MTRALPKGNARFKYIFNMHAMHVRVYVHMLYVYTKYLSLLYINHFTQNIITLLFYRST